MTKALLIAVISVFGVAAGASLGSNNSTDSDDIDADEIVNYNTTVYLPSAKRCAEKLGLEVALRFQNAERQMKQCTGRLGSMRELEVEFEEAENNKTLNQLFAKYCRKRPELVTCFDEFTVNVEPCLDKVMGDTLHLMLAQLPVILDYLCRDDGKELIEVVSKGGVDCVEGKGLDLERCLEEVTEGNPRDLMQSGKLLTAEGCRTFQQLQNCVVNVFQSCPDQVTVNYTAGLINTMYQALPTCAVADGTVITGNATVER